MDNKPVSLIGPIRIAWLIALMLMIPSTATVAHDRAKGVLIRAIVPAALGGTFSDNPENPRITVTIPPGALNNDARLRVRAIDDGDDEDSRDKKHDDDKLHVRSRQTAASPVFKVQLVKKGGRGRLRLSVPMTIAIAADPAPVHPQLGEIAVKIRNKWQRLNANFFRPSDSTVVSLTQRTHGKFRVTHRTLQSVAGPAVERGRAVFMQDTFGNENFFGGAVGLHELLNSVDPVSAVSLGAQVDLNQVPAEIVEIMVGENLDAKDAALSDPATTRALIKAGAVIGVKGIYASDDPADDTLVSAGLTCSLCHVNVTPTEFELNAGTVALPIGVPRFDGVPNVRMDAGAILALTPFAQDAGQPVVDILNSWGPGLFDIRALADNPLEDNVVNPTMNPPIWNFVDLEEQGYSFGWDGLFVNDGINNNALASQAEAVYDLVMHANGAFGLPNGNLPPELAIVPPQELVEALVLAETNQAGNDISTDKLLDLQAWMRSVTSPAPGDFDEAKAEAGFHLFFGKANCVACHSSPDLTGPGLFSDITEQTPSGGLSGGIHVPSLRGISHTAPYFHDGSAATLTDAVARFVARGAPVPPLSNEEQGSLVEYLNSL